MYYLIGAMEIPETRHSVSNHGLALSHLALQSPFHSMMDAFLNQIEIILGF